MKLTIKQNSQIPQDFYITGIYKYDCGLNINNEEVFSCDIIINDLFMLQMGTDRKFEIPRSCLAEAFPKKTINGENAQDWASENLDADEIAEIVKATEAADSTPFQ